MTTALTSTQPYDAAKPVVTLVTALAETGDLSEAAYRQIYDHVAAGRSLRNIELALRSAVTFGWWAKYAAGEKHLDRERKNELRRWATANGGPELPELPPAPAEAVAGRVHPDAAVYAIGVQLASRVVLVGADVPAVSLRVNGSCAVVMPGAALPENASVAGCNRRYSRKPRASIHLSVDLQKRLNERRTAAGQTWDEFLEQLTDL